MMISSRGRAGTPEVFPFRSMRMPDVTTPLRTSSWGATLAAGAASMAWILYRHPLSLSITFAAGLGLLAVLMLALVRFDAAVGLGVLLLAVVRIEPAPTDAVFAVVIAVALLTNRFGLRRVPPIALGLLGAFLALNLFSFVEVIDVSRGLTFFAITLYLVVFAIWLTDYVRSSRRAQLIVRLYVLAAVASALVLAGSTAFLSQRAHLQSYDAQRFSAQALGLREGERYPFGLGPGQFDVVSTVSAHSTYIRAFAEEGLPGLITLFALMFATLLLAMRNVVRGIDTYGLGSAALLGSWLGLVANSLFVDTLHWRHFWLVAALIWAGAMRSERAYASSRTASRSAR